MDTKGREVKDFSRFFVTTAWHILKVQGGWRMDGHRNVGLHSGLTAPHHKHVTKGFRFGYILWYGYGCIWLMVQWQAPIMNTVINPHFGRKRDILTRQVTISLLRTVLRGVSWSVTDMTLNS